MSTDSYFIEPKLALLEMGMTPSKVVTLSPITVILVTSQDMN